MKPKNWSHGSRTSIKEVIPEEEIETLIANIGLPVGKGAGFSTVLSSNSGPDTAYVIVNLKQHGRRTSTKSLHSAAARKICRRVPAGASSCLSPAASSTWRSTKACPVPISVQISAGTLAKCRDDAERVVDVVSRIPGTADVQIAQSMDYPQFDVQVDRTRAKYLGVGSGAGRANRS